MYLFLFITKPKKTQYKNKHKKHYRVIFYRSIDGSDNNLINNEMNAADTELTRITESGYNDQSSSMAGAGRPSPRNISNAALSQTDTKLTKNSPVIFYGNWVSFWTMI